MTALLEQVGEMIGRMNRSEKAQILQWVVSDLGDAFPEIDSRPHVCGGEPCVVRTRIPVWTLVQARRLGVTESDLLKASPRSMRRISQRFGPTPAPTGKRSMPRLRPMNRHNVARLYANENFPQQAVEHLRLLGDDVET